MNPTAGKFFAAVVMILAFTTHTLLAQQAESTLSGAVTDPSGKVLANAKVSIKNLTTGESTNMQTDSSGLYTVPNLAAGEYEVSASVEGIGAGIAEVTVAGAKPQTLNLALTTGAAATPSELPSAPSSSKTAPSLEDLGFSPAESQANAKEQALLDKRTHMLKIHQRMGLITTVPMIASVVTSLNAGGRSTSKTSRDVHVALGALTGDLYGITAYYAIRAPRVPGTETKGPIRLHKALAWIHGPGMILTPILGAIAFDQKSKGEKVHGIAAAHGPVAIVTAAAFGAALLSVSAKF